MQQPLQIAFLGMDPSDAIVDDVRARARKLGRFHDRITSCRVTVQAPHRHQHKGVVYGVRVEVHVPEEAIVAGKERHAHHEHEDVFVAIRDAFEAARRQLERIGSKRRARRHVLPPLQ